MAAALIVVALLARCTGEAWASGQAGTSATRARIVTLAQQQLGYHDQGPYCTKFGPCELWCSLFVTWTWRQAAVPVPSLAFTGYLYDWAQATTAAEGPKSLPQPGDAVLYGSGPATVSTSLHTGIVEAVYPGYLVTIEGDVLHAVRRFVVPLRDPQLVGEPGPIYGYASPLPSAGGGPATAAVAGGRVGARARSGSRLQFAPLAPAVIARQQLAPRRSSEQRRLLAAIAALRAFQHMPYHGPHVLIDWTGIDGQGRVQVRVTSALPVSYARSAWQAFLQRYDDAGHAYVVSFDAPLDAPVASSPPAIAGTPVQGQTLIETHAGWSNDPTAFAYQWQDCDDSGQTCSVIAGATGPTYTLTTADVGHTIRVAELASNAGGAGQPATSGPTAAVAPLS